MDEPALFDELTDVLATKKNEAKNKLFPQAHTQCTCCTLHVHVLGTHISSHIPLLFLSFILASFSSLCVSPAQTHTVSFHFSNFQIISAISHVFSSVLRRKKQIHAAKTERITYTNKVHLCLLHTQTILSSIYIYSKEIKFQTVPLAQCSHTHTHCIVDECVCFISFLFLF